LKNYAAFRARQATSAGGSSRAATRLKGRAGENFNAPLERTAAGELFAEAAQNLGYKPFPLPASNASAAYTNPEGARLGACTYCGHCVRFGGETNAKASPNTTLVPALLSEARFTLRSGAWVSQILYDRQARPGKGKAHGVLYTDTASGETYEQPADLVIVAGYVFTNTKLLLTSGIGRPYDPATGKGAVGRNCAYQTGGGVQVFLKTPRSTPLLERACWAPTLMNSMATISTMAASAFLTGRR
jgi:gluconate 2-dehydrogenase alpha chain